MALLPRETELLRLHDQYVSDASDDNTVKLLEYIDSNYDEPDLTSPQFCKFNTISQAVRDYSTFVNTLEQYPASAPVTVMRSILHLNKIRMNIKEEKVNPSWMKFNNKFTSSIVD